MNQRQINRLEMFKATDDYLNSQSSVWTPIPIIGTYKTKLTEIIDTIKSTAQDQDAAQVFISSSLQDMKRQIAIKMDILDDTLEAYADDTENAELLSLASNASSDYLRLPNEEFETKTKNMIDLVEEHAESMADYGMTVVQIDDVKLSFGIFQDKRGKPRSYRIASQVATRDLEELVAEGMTTVGRLDKVLKRFKRSNTTFYNGYLAARIIIDK